MVKFTGLLKLDADGKMILTMQITPQNPNMEDIPVADLVEDLLNQRVQIEVLPLKTRYNKKEEK